MNLSKAGLMFAVFALLVGACGDDDSTSETGAGSGGGGSEISGKIFVQASGGDSELAAVQTLADEFEADFPGTDVELIAVADRDDHSAKLATAFAGGEPPDVFLINYRRMGRFVENGVIEPADLGDIAVDDLYDTPVQAFTFDDTLLCIPQNVSSIVMYYNPALFDEAGVEPPTSDWTWDEALTKAQDISDAGIEAIGFDAAFRTVAPFVWSAGGEIVDDVENPTEVTLDTPEARKAIQFLLDLQETGLDATERAASEPEEQFASGDVAMFIDSRRAVPSLRKAGVDFDVVQLPQDVEPASSLNSDGWCVSKASKNKPLAHAFSQYASGADGGEALALTGRTVPVLKELAESPAFLDPDQPPANSQVWLDIIPHLRKLPTAPNWEATEVRTDDTVEQLFAGRTSLDDAIDEIVRESQDTLSKS